MTIARNVFLSRPEVIDAVNRYFVPVNLDWAHLAYTNRSSSEIMLAEKVRWMATHATPAGCDEPPATHHNGVWVLTPERKLVWYWNVNWLRTPREAKMACESLLAFIQAQGLQRHDPPLSSDAALDLRNQTPDALEMRITARFLLTHDLKSQEARIPALLGHVRLQSYPSYPPPIEMLLGARLQAPVEERVVVPSASWRQLLPPPDVSAWRLPSEPVEQIARHLCPPTHNYYLDGCVLSAEWYARVVKRVGEVLTVRIEGSYSAEHRLWGGADDNSVRADVIGNMTCDVRAQRITAFELVTDLGRYGNGTSFDVPFIATATLP